MEKQRLVQIRRNPVAVLVREAEPEHDETYFWGSVLLPMSIVGYIDHVLYNQDHPK